jgi:hypothetical protein
VSKRKSPGEADRRLQEIAAEIAAGAPASRFDAEIDRLLGTGIPAADAERDEAWERGRRRR